MTPTVQNVIAEITALANMTISTSIAKRACDYVRAHPEQFSVSTGMSSSEAADLAIEIAMTRKT